MAKEAIITSREGTRRSEAGESHKGAGTAQREKGGGQEREKRSKNRVIKFRIKNGKVDLIKTKAEVRSVVLLEGYWGK